MISLVKQRSSPVIYKLVRETIASLQHAEVRIKPLFRNNTGTDPDLFMIKNLLILKNELLTLEIGDVRNGAAPSQGASGVLGSSIQHLSGQILQNLPTAGSNLLGLVSSSVSTLGSYIPGSGLLSRAAGTITGSAPGAGAAAGAAAAAAGEQDASEQLDELLRQSIYSFTRRWAAIFNEAKVKANVGGKNLGQLEKELDEILQEAFSSQPEVTEKLKEAIQLEAQGQLSGGGSGGGVKMSGTRTGKNEKGSVYGGSRASRGSSRRL